MGIYLSCLKLFSKKMVGMLLSRLSRGENKSNVKGETTYITDTITETAASSELEPSITTCYYYYHHSENSFRNLPDILNHSVNESWLNISLSSPKNSVISRFLYLSCVLTF